MDAFDLGETDRLLTTTRTVRRRLDLTSPVDTAEVHDALRVALQAPSNSNRQAWRWILITDPDVRGQVASLYRQAYDELASPASVAAPSGADARDRLMASTDHLARVLDQVPLLVIPCVLDRLPPDAPTRKAANLFGGIYPAVWSFQLALRSRGYGSALTTMHLAYEAEVAAILGIPDSATQVGLLPVARFTGDTFGVAERAPVEDVAFDDHWGQPLLP